MAEELRPGLILHGRFELLRQLGSGGAASVWLAREPGGPELALKVLHSKFRRRQSMVRRLVNEGNVLAELAHPAIARPIEYVEDDAHASLAMELVEGRTLERLIGDHCRRDVYLPDDDIARIFAQMCEAIAFAHEKGVIHRDLKPQNVMIQEAAGALSAKVLDFGIAKLLDSSTFDATTHGRRIGSLFYMAPEQVRGEAATPQSDIFALGSILFELLTLRRAWARDAEDRPLRAFDGAMPDARANALPVVMMRISSGPRLRPSELRAELPRALDGVVVRATAIAAADRPRSALELLEDFRHAAGAPAAVAPTVQVEPVEPSSPEEDVSTVRRPPRVAIPVTISDEDQLPTRLAEHELEPTHGGTRATSPGAEPEGEAPEPTHGGTRATSPGVAPEAEAPESTEAEAPTPIQTAPLDPTPIRDTAIRPAPVRERRLAGALAILTASLAAMVALVATREPRGPARDATRAVDEGPRAVAGPAAAPRQPDPRSKAPESSAPRAVAGAPGDAREISPATRDPRAIAEGVATARARPPRDPPAGAPGDAGEAPPAPRDPRASTIGRRPDRTAPVTSRDPELTALRAQLARLADDPGNLELLTQLGGAINRAAGRIADVDRRTRVRRIAQSSAMAGDVAGLELALDELAKELAPR